MREVPQSRLMLLSPKGRHREQVEKVLQGFGIERNRIQHVARQPRSRYLDLYTQIDLSLDTFPYNGHTTSLDSFWMGVPVITRIGPTVVGRAGFSESHNLKLGGFVANSEVEFAEIAKKWSDELDGLSSIRQTLRQRMEASPLMDGQRFTESMESSYRTIWRTWCERSRRD